MSVLQGLGERGDMGTWAQAWAWMGGLPSSPHSVWCCRPPWQMCWRFMRTPWCPSARQTSPPTPRWSNGSAELPPAQIPQLPLSCPPGAARIGAEPPVLAVNASFQPGQKWNPIFCQAGKTQRRIMVGSVDSVQIAAREERAWALSKYLFSGAGKWSELKQGLYNSAWVGESFLLAPS